MDVNKLHQIIFPEPTSHSILVETSGSFHDVYSREEGCDLHTKERIVFRNNWQERISFCMDGTPTTDVVCILLIKPLVFLDALDITEGSPHPR